MTKVTEWERIIIQQQNPKNKLIIASVNKQSGGSTYYIQNNDIDSLKILSKIRNQTIKEIINKM